MQGHQKEVLFSTEVLDVVQKKFEQCKSPQEAWAPTDFIPEFNPSSDWAKEITELQEKAKELSDPFFMALAGNMITEEGLPTFLTWINQNEHIGDKSGVDDHPWAKWARAWTAEENKHGDLLHKYLYLCGRVDMRAVEESIGDFLRNGFTTKTSNNPYRGMVFTSFQERATRISHSRLANDARKVGNDNLAKICQVVAADEGRHEAVYQSFVSEIFKQDPSNMMIAFLDTMKTGITMPLSATGSDTFSFFSEVTEAIGMYTYLDYIDILEFLNKRWNIESYEGLTPEATAAQEYLCKLPERLKRIATRKKPKDINSIERDLLWVKPRKAGKVKVDPRTQFSNDASHILT